jgi:hypothetical protein
MTPKAGCARPLSTCPPIDLRRQGLEYQTEFKGSQGMAKIVEKLRIYGYFFENGALPPGNKIFR